MVGKKGFQMFLLGNAQDAGAVTQGTGVFQGGQHGVPDEFRTVGDAHQGLFQRGIGFETDKFLFFVHGNSFDLSLDNTK